MSIAAQCFRRAARPLFYLCALLVAGACSSQPDRYPMERVREALAADDQAVLSLATGDTLRVSEAVREFYRDRAYEPAWVDATEVNEAGRGVLETLSRSTDDGLEPERYGVDVATRLLGELEENEELDDVARADHLGDLELVLSEGYSRYTIDVSYGTLDPATGGVEWLIPRGKASDLGMLHAVADGADPLGTIAQIRPAAPHYARLMESLERYREIERAGGWPAVPEGETLEEGAESPRVHLLRQRLIAEGARTETELARRGEANPTRFDGALKEALEHFQRRHNLEIDGALGSGTLEELNVPVEARLLDIRLNMDRWRWLPRDLGERYILVNVAGYELEVIEGGSPVLTMNVVVGQEAWETPLFSDTLEYVVTNPYWNVPASIAREEIIPAVRNNPGYLARNDFEAVLGEQVVSPAALDYSALERYRFRQRPGPQNALGKVKFMFPNDHNIYLHDTPARHLFGQRARAASHGCIRVEKPAELAQLLFQWSSERSPEDYERNLARSGEQWISLGEGEGVPIYILYFTAWVNEDGTTRFHHDIYGRDEILHPHARDRLERVAAAPRR